MEKEVSIVLSPDCKNYRRVAQRAWNLTNEQMKGMHVHHFPPVSEGGRNIPEHLYVCSPQMHANGWHNGEYFVEQATTAGFEYGARGGARGGKCPWWSKNGEDVRSWECPGEGWKPGRAFTSAMGSLPYWNNGKENRRSEHCPGEGWTKGTAQIWWTNGEINEKGIECPGEGWFQGRSSLAANKEKWMCTVTGKISTAGPLTIYQKSQNIETSNRVKVTQ